MDKDGWLKAMTQFSNICGASPFNNQILFFDGNDIHFNDYALTQMQSKNIQPSILKAGDSINDQPDDNGSNSKLKAIYNISKAEWMLKYGTKRFQPCHINSVLVDNIPLDWTVHHTPYGYMDRYWWIKAMTQFSNICGTSPVNNQILFFCGHDSRFDDRSLTQMQSKNIQPFILKAGDSPNKQPNENEPKSKLKVLYNILKAK